MVSIALPKRIEEKLKERAEETGTLPEELTLDLIIQGLKEEIDPEELAEHYQTLSQKYFQEAKQLLNEGGVVQASEKFWGASALAVKGVAAKRGLKLEKHGSLWDFMSQVAQESAEWDIITLFHVANSLRRNFYENQMNKRSLEAAAVNIEKLMFKLRGFS